MNPARIPGLDGALHREETAARLSFGDFAEEGAAPTLLERLAELNPLNDAEISRLAAFGAIFTVLSLGVALY